MNRGKIALVTLVIALVVAVVFTNGLASHRARFAVSDVPLGIGSLAVPTAVPSATSVSWYCVVPPVLAGQRSDGLLLENPTRFQRRLLISAEVGRAVEHGLLLAHSSLRLFVKPGHARVIVSSGGMIAFVETQATASATPQIEPCSSSPSDNWAFEGLSTRTGTNSTISIYNPFKVQAVIDVRYYSPQGVVSVPLVEGLIVDPGKVMTINAERFAPNATDIAATVSARSGSIVAMTTIADPDAQQSYGFATPSSHIYLPYVLMDAAKDLTIDLLNTSAAPDPTTIFLAGFNGTKSVADMGPMRSAEHVTVPPDSSLHVDLGSIASATSANAVAVKVSTRSPLFGLGVIDTTSPALPFVTVTPTYFHSSHWWVSCVADSPSKDPEVVFSRGALASIVGGSLVGGAAQSSTSTNVLRPSVGPLGLAAGVPSLYQIQLSTPMTVGTTPVTEGCAALPAAE